MGGGGARRDQWEFEKQFATLSDKSLKLISLRSLVLKCSVEEEKNKHRLFAALEGEIVFPRVIRLLKNVVPVTAKAKVTYFIRGCSNVE